MRQQKGFTLIELLVVIAIIAILASLAIPQYINYQKKAKVSSYAEPAARACMMDIVTYCSENAKQTVDPNNLTNCKNRTISTAGGTVTLNPPNSFNCGDNGETPDDTTVTATLDTATGYQAKCFVKNQSVRCTVESQ